MRTKFCSTFFGFGWSISKLFAYNFQHVCHKRNLRLSGNFFGEKLLILTNWLFYKTFRFLGESFFSDFWRKNYTLNIRKKLLSKSVFLRKLKSSKFFGNFSEVRRKFFRSLGEVFRRKLSKLHSTGQEKLFEGFYFEVKRILWPFNGHWAKHFWTFGGKNSTGMGKLHSKHPEKCFEQKCFFLRKLKFSNFFGTKAKNF